MKKNSRQHRPDQKGGTPAMLGIEHGRIEQHDRTERAERRADPERAVDDEIGPAAHARRDQLLNGRIDRGIFAPYAGTGQEAEKKKAPEIPRERRHGRRQQVDAEGDEEQLLAPEPVREPAEEDGAQDRARKINAAGKTHVRIGKAQHRACLQGASHGAGKRHFEAVENPGDAEGYDHERVEARPGQPVEPRRNSRLDDWRSLRSVVRRSRSHEP